LEGKVDLKQYFRKIREIEAGIGEPYPIVVSRETTDGGKAGMLVEVPRTVAAKMIADGRAVLASEEEKELYRLEQASAKQASEQTELARRIQVTILNEADLLGVNTGKRKGSEPSPAAK
jgi:hypothetical protein